MSDTLRKKMENIQALMEQDERNVLSLINTIRSEWNARKDRRNEEIKHIQKILDTNQQ